MLNGFLMFLAEKSDHFHSIDSFTLYSEITKNLGQKEYFESLLGDRKMFVSELKDLAKKEKLDIEDYNQIYLKFAKHFGFDASKED